MTKNEFLQGLKEELEGRVTHSAMRSHTACRSVELPLWHTLRLLSGLVRPDCSAV